MAINLKNILPPLFLKEGGAGSANKPNCLARLRDSEQADRGSSGLTLTELLISTAVIGIIMLGVTSSNYAVHKQSSNASERSAAVLNAQLMLIHILNNAYLAVGSSTDPGFQFGHGNPQPFCIRTNASPVNPWVCYKEKGGKLTTCQQPTASFNCNPGDFGYNGNLGALHGSGVTQAFTQTSTPGAQQNTFTATVTVPDTSSSSGEKSLTSSISPPRHRI